MKRTEPPQTPFRAVISLGTNTTRLLVVRDRHDGDVEIVERGSIGTRLGEGLRERGELGAEPMRRTLDAIATFMQTVGDRRARVWGIATSAMRRASNAEPFMRQVADLIGSSLAILDGKSEATASFIGATYGAHSSAQTDRGRVAVIDVGGGSTECAIGRAGALEDASSLEIGAVRLAERHPELMGSAPRQQAAEAATRARSEARALAAQFAEYRPVREALAVGGTPLTVGAIAFASDVDSVSGRSLAREDLNAVLEHMLSLDLAARRELRGMLPQRADILPAGTIILSEVLRALDVRSVTLQANDLLLGYLLSFTDNNDGIVPR
ncbi:MAG: ethanolamine ammonia-lyase reactivating factor EutA [Candidatus Eremiobacteraeota bacterium]|nr:ethanolamine ammonia-lyase reactivating factor EutA [Candidatus Eremiobacteraeota bacterium]MBV9648389.1 ethanolamine ammonia-lyase reactivating factor EutA [Candidatus Eremiobacteraeota bacterium]